MMTHSQTYPATRRVLGSYATYPEAQRVVDQLSDAKFPVQHVGIIGKDVRLTEKVTGRLTVARAALAGMATGAWFGLFIGFVFWIVSPWAPEAVLSGVLLGAVFGATWGAVAHFLTGGQRDFTSVAGLEAATYDVVVDESHYTDALRILGTPHLAADATSPPSA
jgi:hypothetical protein